LKSVTDSHFHLSQQLVHESRARIQSGRATAAQARTRIQRRRANQSRSTDPVWTFTGLLAARVEQSRALITMSRELIRIGDELVALSRRRR